MRLLENDPQKTFRPGRVLNAERPEGWSGLHFSGNHILETPVSMPVRAGKLIPLLMEFLDAGKIDRGVMRRADVFVNDRLVPRQDWLATFVAEGDRVQVYARVKGGGGGKNVMQLVAALVVVVAAAFATWYVGGLGVFAGNALPGFVGPVIPGALAGWGGVAGAVAGAAVMMGGMLLVGQLFRQKTALLGMGQDAKNYVIESTRNASRLYNAQEILIGRARVSPSYAAAYFSTFEGDTQYFHMLVQVSTGDVHVETDTIRLGDTPISQYNNAQYWVYEGWKGEGFRYFDFKRREVQESVDLKYNAWITRQTDAGVRKIILLIQFPMGLYWAKKDGGTESTNALFRYRWRRAGETGWLGDVTHETREEKKSAFVRTLEIAPPTGDPAGTVYEYEIMRADDSVQLYDRHIGKTAFVGAQYWYNEKALEYRAPFSKTLIEVRIKADGQLNGAVNDLNCIAQSYGYVPDGSGNFNRRLTTNPAALAAHFITDETRTSRPYPAERIDWRTVREHYNFCEQYGFEYSAVRSDGAKSGVVAADILSAGLGWLVPGERFRFAFDGLDEDYVDVATPWTCWGFELKREYPIYPVHGLRVEFPNREQDWQLDETVVYMDGYNAGNATEIVQWTPAEGNRGTSGVDNFNCVYKLARIKLAQIVQRPETLSWHTNWRSLDYHVGQRIAVAYDTYLVGAGQGNALCYVEVAGEPRDSDDEVTLCAGIQIIASIAMRGVKIYVARDGAKQSEKTWTLRTVEGPQSTLFFQFPIPVGSAPKLMVPVLVGEAGRDVMVCTIISISRDADFVATVTAVPTKGREILAAISGPIPPFDSKITTPSYYQVGQPLPPVVTGIRSDESFLPYVLGAFIPHIGIAFYLPYTQGVTVAQVRAQYRLAGESMWSDGGHVAARENEIFLAGVAEGATYEVRLAAVSDAGVLSEWTAAFTETVIGRTTPPPAPISVRLNGNMLLWDMPEDTPIDVIGWEVWMGMDETDDFSYALNISRGYVTERTFDLTPWAAHSRRVWVRTVDDLGLVSEPVSAGVNLGDALVANVVVEISEAGKNWPGTITQGRVILGSLVADTEAGFWDGNTFWSRSDFWCMGTSLPMTYVTGLAIPEGVAGCELSLALEAPQGASPRWNTASRRQIRLLATTFPTGSLRLDGALCRTNWPSRTKNTS